MTTSDISVFVNLIFFIIVFLLGLPGNVVIIQTYAWKKRKTSTDILILAQAVVDMIACVFAPVFIIRSVFHELITPGLCKMASLAENSTAFASLFLTTAISIDRYIVVCHPLRRKMTVRRSIAVGVLCAVISIAINIPVAILTEARNQKKIGRKFCDLPVSFTSVTWVATMTSLALFLVSFLTNTLFYGLIYAFLRKRAKIHADLVGNALPVATVSPNADSSVKLDSSSKANDESVHDAERHDGRLHVSSFASTEEKAEGILVASQLDAAGSSYAHPPQSTRSVDTGSNPMCSVNNKQNPIPAKRRNSIAPEGVLSNRHGPEDRPTLQKKKRENAYGKKTTRMLLIVTIVFFVTWTPKIIIPLISRVVLLRGTRIPGFVVMLQVMLSLRHINHITNFFVYYLVNNRFRRDVKESCLRCRCTNLNS